MIHYIVDTSIVIQHLIADVHTTHVDGLFEQMEITVGLIVPEFCLLECVNVLWKRARFHGLPHTEAEELAQTLSSSPLSVFPTAPLLTRALQIGLKHQLAVYDSLYLALAEKLGHPLITDDSRQAAAATAEGITLKPITDFQPVT